MYVHLEQQYPIHEYAGYPDNPTWRGSAILADLSTDAPIYLMFYVDDGSGNHGGTGNYTEAQIDEVIANIYALLDASPLFSSIDVRKTKRTRTIYTA